MEGGTCARSKFGTDSPMMTKNVRFVTTNDTRTIKLLCFAMPWLPFYFEYPPSSPAIDYSAYCNIGVER